MKNKKLSRLMLTVVVAAGAGCLMGNQAFADLPFNAIYEFTGTATGDNQNNSVTAQPTAATFSKFTRTGVTFNSADNYFNSKGWSSASSIDTSKYVQYSLVANSGYSLTLTDISFKDYRSGTGPSSLRVSMFVGSDLTNAVASSDFTVPTTLPSTAYTFDFADIVNTTDVITFRFYGWNASSGSGTLRFDNVLTNGTYASLGFTPATIYWSAGDNTWNKTATNWATSAGGAAGTVYHENSSGTAGDDVNFTTGGNVSIAAAVTPNSVTISNASGSTLSLTGSAINGGGTVTINGGGTVNLPATNGYTGGTVISNGSTLNLSSNDQLGTGTLTLSGGNLNLTGAITTARVLSVAAGTTSALNTNGNSYTTTGASTINGTLNKQGAGDLTFKGAVTFTSTGQLNVAAGGSVTFDSSGTTATTYLPIYNGGQIDGDINVVGVPFLEFEGGTYTGAGAINIKSAPSSQGYTPIIQNWQVSGADVQLKINLNSDKLAFTPGSWSGTTYTAGNFAVCIAGSNSTAGSGGFTISGVISGDSDVNFSQSNIKAKGSGYVILSAHNTYTGDTLLNTINNIADAPTGVVLGIDDALPVKTNVIFGTLATGSTTTTTAPILDLHGFNQQIGSLSSTNVVATQTGFLIVNSGSTKSTLTISGSSTPGLGFGGIIQDGNSAIAVVKSGSNTLVLNGANTYSGGTTVTGGTLVFGSTTARPSSDTLTINGGQVIIGGDSANIDTYRSAISSGTITSTGASHYGIGYLTGADYKATNSNPAGYSVLDSDVVLKYTILGDANLDGVINAMDYTQIDASYRMGLYTVTGGSWATGDFNYDGKVDATDFAIIDAAYAAQSGSSAAALARVAQDTATFGVAFLAAYEPLVSEVPEPASLGMLVLAGAGLLARRRR